jgi:hypothetical protein
MKPSRRSRCFAAEMFHQQHQEDEARAALYRQSARRLRQIAAELRFDLCRREQLLSLAGAFERLADRLEDSPAKQAAD